MKNILLILTVLSAAVILPLSAETIRFRSGRMLCAELSSQKPPHLEISADKVPWLPDKPLYAALTVVPDAGRGISIYDYKLHAFGQDYPCIAVLDTADNSSHAVISPEDAGYNRKYTLYFVVNGLLLGMKNPEPIILRTAAAREKYQEQQVFFVNCGNKKMTSPDSVPRNGKMFIRK